MDRGSSSEQLWASVNSLLEERRGAVLEQVRGKANGRTLIWVVALVALHVWAFRGVNFSPAELVRGLPYLFDLVSRMVPPALSVVPEMIRPTLETLQMAIVATTAGAILALPVGFAAARNVNGNHAVYHLVRFVLDALRAIPEMIYALIFVAAVGLGAFPGVMALILDSVGYLGKMYSEVIENIDPKPVEAVKAAGAIPSQVVSFAVLPQALPVMLSYVLYKGEVNVRAATVLGIVGAGGIGFELQQYMRLFKYPEAVTIIILILVIVTVIDRASACIRARLV